MRPRIVLASALLVLASCSALQELAALRSVRFDYRRVSDVRIAGVPLSAGASFGSLSLADAARLGRAVVAKEVPLELVAHVDATNPAENRVPARMTALTWSLWVDDARALDGSLVQGVRIEPGASADVALAVRFDLLSLAQGGARDLFDLALAVAGYGGAARDVRLELVPTIETSIGPMRYPAPIVLRRDTTR